MRNGVPAFLLFFENLPGLSLALRFLIITLVLRFVEAVVQCPENAYGTRLKCAFECCRSLEANSKDYYCCGGPHDYAIFENNLNERTDDHSTKVPQDAVSRAQRFIATYGDTIRIDYTLLVIGLVLSVILSIICSVFCCLLCNGCWLRRRRHPDIYETVSDGGFYPLCCGFGIPTGTVVFSTQPPQFRADDHMMDSATMSAYSSRSGRVRFNSDGTPRGVLKKEQNTNER